MAVVYTTVDFDMDSAVNGALVGVNVQDPSDLSLYCGVLKVIEDSPIDVPTYTKNGRTVKSIYQVTIKGSTIWCSDTGVVLSCVPALTPIPVNTPLKVLKAVITTTSGTSQSRSRSPQSGHTASITISELEPRDQFALHALTVIMNKLEHPEATDDANIIQACYTSYRWANAMMLAAADARTELENYTPPTPSDETPKEEVNVNTDTLSSNVERLLYNINAALHNKNVNDKKLIDEGFKVSAMPSTSHVTIDGTPSVSINGTPNVNVSNTPNVNVSNTPNVNVSNIPNVNVTNMPTDVVTDSDIDNAKNAILNAMPSEYAKSSDVTSAKNDIIDAMPSCKYTPPSDNNNNNNS